MSHSWVFSPSSNKILQRLKDASSTRNVQNKWLGKFNAQQNLSTHCSQKYDSQLRCDNEKNNNETSLPTSDEITNELKLNSSCRILQDDPSNVNYLVEECLKTPNLTEKLANQLPIPSVEKISLNLIAVSDIDKLKFFYQQFLPEFLKRERNWLSTGLLEQSSKAHPSLFKDTLKIILKNTQISNDILLGYIQNLNMEQKLCVLNVVMEADLSSDEFCHKLLSIYIAYVDCNKNERLQNYIYNYLKICSNNCVININYGKLLLIYLQAQHNLGYSVNISELEKLIEIHRTHFKRSCITKLKNFSECQ